MNRYPRGRPSQASATTQCQKCLQRGHFSYECKTSAGERPYIARPSRTQQLLNPKYAPKLSEVVPPEDTMRRAGVADEILARKDEERGRKRQRHERDSSLPRSNSISSVSTISTAPSRSPEPVRDAVNPQRSKKRSRSPSARRRHRSHRRRSRSVSSRSSDDKKADRRKSSRREHYKDERSSCTVPSRSLRSPSFSPSSSRSPHNYTREARHSRRVSPPRKRFSHDHAGSQQAFPSRQKSLSPYSKRVALTQSMNR